jgi:hypothetical protein
MPNWKKVITSGSIASLDTLTVSNGITGSLLGTATTASYISPTFISSSAASSGFGSGGGETPASKLFNYYNFT